MDDFDFDKLFADKMRRAGAPDHSDEDWERLNPKLDTIQRRRWRVLPLWWLGALSALLLCSNLGWWWMWQGAEKNTESLRQEWQLFQVNKTIQRDTTWSKVVVYQYDTVYRTLVYRVAPEYISMGKNNGLKSGVALRGTADIDPALANKSVGEQSNVQTLSSSNTVQPSNTETPAIVPGTQPVPLDLFQLPFRTTYLTIPARPVKTPQEELVLIPKKPSKTPFQSVLIPKKLRLGAGGGMVIPGVKPLGGSIGSMANLTTEIAFSDALALVLEGSYSGISYRSTEYNEGFGLPAYPYPGDDFELKHLETDEELKIVWQIGAGFRYWWRPSHRLSPYLGLGYAAQWHPEYAVKLEFINTLTGGEKELSLAVPALNKAVSMLDFNAGVRYQIWRKLCLQTGAAFQLKLNPNQAAIPRYFGLKAGVLYAF